MTENVFRGGLGVLAGGLGVPAGDLGFPAGGLGVPAGGLGVPASGLGQGHVLDPIPDHPIGRGTAIFMTLVSSHKSVCVFEG